MEAMKDLLIDLGRVLAPVVNYISGFFEIIHIFNTIQSWSSITHVLFWFFLIAISDIVAEVVQAELPTIFRFILSKI